MHFLKTERQELTVRICICCRHTFTHEWAENEASKKRTVCEWYVHKCDNFQLQVDFILQANFKQIFRSLATRSTLKLTNWNAEIYTNSSDSLHREFFRHFSDFEDIDMSQQLMIVFYQKDLKEHHRSFIWNWSILSLTLSLNNLNYIVT